MGIGKLNNLPWHLSSDLQRFKQLTQGHHLIMGRKTWQSINKPLPGRIPLVISRSKIISPQGVIITRSLEEALSIAKSSGEDEVFIIGGGDIFNLAIEKADCIYLTEIDAIVDADVFFPDIERQDWEEVHTSSQQKRNQDEYASTYKILVRKSSIYFNEMKLRFTEIQ